MEDGFALDMECPCKIGPYLSPVRHAPTILLVVFAALALSFPLADTDIWWHLAAGRAMIEASSWLRADPFCLSSIGMPWIDLHWGFQLLAWASHRIAGDVGLLVLRIALVATTVAVALRARVAWITIALAIVILFSMRTFLDLRPLLVTLLALALLWNLLERNPSIATLAGTIVLQIVLANTQGLFALGPLFALAAATGFWIEGRLRNARAALLLTLLMVAASLLNPWGLHAFGLAGKVASRIVPSATNLFSTEIPENLPLHLWIAQQPSRILPLAWILLGTIVFWRRGPGMPGRLLLLAGTLVLAFMAVRNLPIAALAILLSVAPRPIGPRSLAPVLTSVLAGALAAHLLLERRWNDPSSFVAPLRLPSERTLALLADAPGPVFHEIRAGGWLTWKIPDRGACWCDTRLVLHDAAFVADYLDVVAHPSRFETWSRERGFRFALVPVAEMPYMDDLAATLFASPSWKLVDCDGAWALFARSEAPLPAIDWTRPSGRIEIERRLRERFSDNFRLADFARTRLEYALAAAAIEASRPTRNPR